LGTAGSGNWPGFIFDDKDRAPTMPVEPRFCSVAAGDLDGDGDVDLYFGDYQQGPPPDRPEDLDDRLWINDGNGYFTDQSEARMTEEMLDSAFGMAAAIADMNGDGVLDVIKDTALVFPQRVSISYNDPNNEGVFNVFDVPHELAPYHMTVGDLNNDGRLDMVITDDGPDRYDLNDGNGAQGAADFTQYVFSFIGGGSDNEFGGNNLIVDLDNDGWNDVIITDVDVDIPGCTRRTHIYRNLANPPNVTLQEQLIGGAVVGIPIDLLKGTHDIAVFDINGDGWKDMVIGRCSSTEVWINKPIFGIIFEYPLGLPEFVTPGKDTLLQVSLVAFGDVELDPDSPTLHLSLDGGEFQSQTMQPIGSDMYEFTLPGATCLTQYDYYVSAQVSSGEEFVDPPFAPLLTHEAIAALGTELLLRDEIEGDVSGWTIISENLDAGEWEQADPNPTFLFEEFASPADDATEGDGVMAFITENGPPDDFEPGTADVDGGPTYLISPMLDLSGTDATITYDRWMFSGLGELDSLTTDVSNDAGQSWVPIPELTTENTGSAWRTVSFVVSDYVEPTATVQVRFTVSDQPNNSITEAGIDNFQVDILLCGEEPPCEGDANGDGAVDPLDSGYVLARFGCPVGTGDPSCDAADQNGDGTVDPLDSGFVLARFGDCP
ncbi:MAG: VCBS repeat-containing protein, partial [Planctomycetes bacterium]|nr:VCBS repeat-containing protein [Planctomycetota bacterium]